MWDQLCLPETVGGIANLSTSPGQSSSPRALQDTHHCFQDAEPRETLTYYLDISGFKGAMRAPSVPTSEHREQGQCALWLDSVHRVSPTEKHPEAHSLRAQAAKPSIQGPETTRSQVPLCPEPCRAVARGSAGTSSTPFLPVLSSR